MSAHLNTLRNEMIRVSLFMEVSAVCLGVGSLFAGIMGMNLIHGFETHPYAFYVATSGLSIFMVSVFLKFYQYYRF